MRSYSLKTYKVIGDALADLFSKPGEVKTAQMATHLHGKGIMLSNSTISNIVKDIMTDLERNKQAIPICYGRWEIIVDDAASIVSKYTQVVDSKYSFLEKQEEKPVELAYRRLKELKPAGNTYNRIVTAVCEEYKISIQTLIDHVNEKRNNRTVGDQSVQQSDRA